MDASTWAVVRDRRVAKPPRRLWRVAHSDKQDCVFTSRATPVFRDDDDFCELREQHLDWYNNEPTPFISTFASKRHTFNWAAQRVQEMDDHSVGVYQVLSQGLVVFGAGGDEFLVLDEIPDANIGDYICASCLAKGEL